MISRSGRMRSAFCTKSATSSRRSCVVLPASSRVNALELDPVGVVELEFGGVLDRYHALCFGEGANDRSKQGALSRAGCSRDQDVRAGDCHGLEEGSHLK